MYYVESSYSRRKEGIFDTLEEALASAQERASTDYEGYFFYVNEIKALVRADIPAYPVKTLEVTSETKKLLLGSASDEGQVIGNATEVQVTITSSQDEV